MPNKSDEGVALNIPKPSKRYEDGVPVVVAAPKTTAKKAASKKAGQQANTTEEKD